MEKSAKPEQNRIALEQFLLPLDIIDFDHQAAEAYGHIRVQIEREGLPIGAMDFLIGAHARSTNHILVTNNMREFARIQHLQLGNWLEEPRS